MKSEIWQTTNNGPTLKVLFFGSDPERVKQIAGAMQGQWPDLKPLGTKDNVAVADVSQQEGLDLVMFCDDLPDPGIFAAIEETRSISDVPIIVAAEGGQEDDVLKAIELGVDHYIRLPCSSEQVLARVLALFRRMGRV